MHREGRTHLDTRGARHVDNESTVNDHQESTDDARMLRNTITHTLTATLHSTLNWDFLKLTNLRAAALIPAGHHGAPMSGGQLKDMVSGFLDGFLLEGGIHVSADCLTDLGLFQREVKQAIAQFESHHADKGWEKTGTALHDLQAARTHCSEVTDGDNNVVDQVAEKMQTTSPKVFVGNVVRSIIQHGKIDELVDVFAAHHTDEDKAPFVYGKKLGAILSDALAEQFVNTRKKKARDTE
eukprot:GEMP01046355.1.p1 GENE.GEMP01046355.1~~GEMP01046355.1.p1  ORF type:complete len:239 (+),score=65.01 GEMP01046355.1:292-1008(+)